MLITLFLKVSIPLGLEIARRKKKAKGKIEIRKGMGIFHDMLTYSLGRHLPNFDSCSYYFSVINEALRLLVIIYFKYK